MFREVWLHEDERDLHRFLLRTAEGAIMDCRMKRLTFGVRPSPFLATQVIRHLALQHQDTHPEASLQYFKTSMLMTTSLEPTLSKKPKESEVNSAIYLSSQA